MIREQGVFMKINLLLRTPGILFFYIFFGIITLAIAPSYAVIRVTSTRLNDIGDDKVSNKDKIFIALKASAIRGDVGTADSLANQLSDYEFNDYAEYFRIKAHLFTAKSLPKVELDINAFLKRFNGSAIAEKMRKDWLLILGKRADWKVFDREYAQLILKNNIQVKCYELMSRLAKGESIKDIGLAAKDLMQQTTSFEGAWADLVVELIQTKAWTKGQAAYVARSALEKGRDTIAQHMATEDLYADIIKLARSNPIKAYEQVLSTQGRYSNESRSIAWGIVGRFLAIEQDPLAINAYRNQHAAGYHQLLSVQSLEWKVRVALRAKDWMFVKESIETMPDWIRARDDAWTYWYARALNELGDKKGASDYFRKLADHYHFYGQLALESLGLPINIPPQITVTEASIKDLSNKPGLLRAIKLYRLNLMDEGNTEWDWESRSMSDRELIAAGEFAQSIGLYQQGIRALGGNSSVDNLHLRYPYPFIKELKPITIELGLDLSLVYGLIRQESVFNKAALSPDGAVGLMQVMPKTGQDVANKMGMTDYKEANLIEVHTNLVIGSNYLSWMLQKFNGSWPLALAGYNAGPSATARLIKSLKEEMEGAIFVETIPYNEARNYVKKVLSNTSYYSLLITGKEISLKEKLGIVEPKGKRIL